VYIRIQNTNLDLVTSEYIRRVIRVDKEFAPKHRVAVCPIYQNNPAPSYPFEGQKLLSLRRLVEHFQGKDDKGEVPAQKSQLGKCLAVAGDQPARLVSVSHEAHSRRYFGFACKYCLTRSVRVMASLKNATASRRRSSSSAQLQRRKPCPAGPKHSPPRHATPRLSSAPSSRYIASPCETMPSR